MIDSRSSYWRGLVALFLVGCGARSIDTAESNTNWLSGCDVVADCGDGMACECGVCTKNCERVSCPTQLECLAECGSGGSCQKACDGDDDCTELDDDAQCRQGVCTVGAGGLSYSAVNQPNAVDADASSDVPTSSDVAPSNMTTIMTSYPSDTTSDGSTDGVCRVAYVEYPEGAEVFGDGCGYTTCRCDGSGELVGCGGILLPCGLAGTGRIKECTKMFPDGDVRSDAIEVERAVIQGSILSLDIGHSGGCERHDYALCFETVLEASIRQRKLVLIHDAHGDSCEAYLQSTIQFDLTPVSEHYLATQAEGTDSGFVETNYGTYIYRSLSCRESEDAADVTVSQRANTIDTSCSNDDDCVSVRVTADCVDECNVVANIDQAADFERLVGTLNEGACAGYVEAGCSYDAPDCALRSAVCVDGACELAAQ